MVSCPGGHVGGPPLSSAPQRGAPLQYRVRSEDVASRAQDSRGAPSPGTGEEGVLRSHVASSALITAVGTVRDKVKVEDTGAQGKQGLSPQSQAQSPHTKHVKQNPME